MKNKRTKLYNSFVKMGSSLSRHKVLFYILSLTCGLPMTIVGFLVTVVLSIFGKGRITQFGYITTFMFYKPKDWGFSLGAVIFVGDLEVLREGYDGVMAHRTLSAHECGHCFQNAILGPLSPFLVYIPSVIRFWHRDRKIRKHNKLPNPRPPFIMSEYDAIWFEGSATDIGNAYYEYLNEKNTYWG